MGPSRAPAPAKVNMTPAHVERSVRARADLGMAWTLVVTRVVVLAQVILGAYDGNARTVNLGLYSLCLALAVGMSTVTITALLSPIPTRVRRWVALIDALVAVALLVAVPTTLPAQFVVGTWHNWAPGYLLNASLVTWCVLSWESGLALGVLAGLLHFAVGRTTGLAQPSTLIANSVTYPGLAIGCLAFTTWLRRIADDADQARREVVAATRALERERYRVSVHDATTILSQLADPEIPQPMLISLRHQALAESRRLRHFVDDEPNSVGPAVLLGEVLDRAAEGFDDLRIVRNTDLGDAAPLDADVAEALTHAVRTLLHNVRRHARANLVHLHADVNLSHWEVVVSDDGRGFAEDTALGFGLRCQVIEAMERVGADVAIDSCLDEGTTVQIRGAW